MSDFFATPETRKARKPHTCQACFRRIDIGEQYESRFGIDDGKPHRFKRCAHCVAVWAIWEPEDIDGLISDDGYGSWASDTEARDLHELRNMVYFRRQWRRKDGTLYPLPELAVAQ